MAEARFDRLAGGVLVLAAAASVLVMAHHPTRAHAGGFGGLVHGAMIVLLALLAWGFAHWTLRRGVGRPAVLAGAVAYAISVVAHLLAATINGFAVPALAARPGLDHGLFLLAWELNQAFARLGVVATGMAYLLWAHGYLFQRGWVARGLGAVGVACGVLPIALLVSGMLRMDVAGAMLAYALHALWAAMVGLYLWSGRFERDRALSASPGM